MTHGAARRADEPGSEPDGGLPDAAGDGLPGTRPLWRQRDFGIFWAAQTLSVLGDSFALIALPLLVLEATGSVARMGLLTAVGGAASVVAAVFAGAVVDRVDRRRLLIACDLVRMGLYGVIPLVWWFGPQIWLLYAVLPLCEAVGMLFAVGYVTVVRSLVGTGRLTDHLELQLRTSREWLDLDEGRLFDAQIDWVKATYTFSPRSLVRAIAQQSTIERTGSARDRRFSLSGLYAYKLNWQTVFFVGYGDSSITADTGALTLDARSVFMKVAYAFQR